MKKLLLFSAALIISATAQAQKTNESLKRITAAQLQAMVVTEAKVNGDAAAPDFSFGFDNCDLNMKVYANGGDSKFNVNVSWDMARSTHVFYEIQESPNRYELKLGVPAEDINIKFSLGRKLSINANLDDSDVDDFQDLSVLTNNRKEVDDLVFSLNKIVSCCKGI